MKAEILSIGTELLLGSILNTNQQYLTRACAGIGIDVYRHVTVGDNPARIADALGSALERADLVITTGGLGPTADDVTLEAAARVFGLKLKRHAPTYRAILQILKHKKSSLMPSVARQADVPAHARIFPNAYGTAPGILTSIIRLGETKHVLLLPGPPKEMNPMFEKHVEPLLKKLKGGNAPVFVTKSLKFSNIPEANIAAKVDDLLRLAPPLTMGIYARPGEVELKLMSKAPTEPQAKKALKRLEGTVKKRFPHEVILADEETLEGRLGGLLRASGKTLSLAESCTGGLLGHLVTNVSGSSDYLVGSVVAYHNRVKGGLLGVRAATLEKNGAVSAATAEEMARGIRRLYGTHVGVSVTGIAGPAGGTRQKPVGLVFVGLAGGTGSESYRFYFVGKREDIKLKAARAALLLTVKFLSKKEGRKKPHGDLDGEIRI